MAIHTTDILRALSLGLNIKAIAAVPIIGISWFLVRLYLVRSKFRRLLKEHDIPMVPHSFILGHIVAIAKISMKYKLPPDSAGFWNFYFLKMEYPELASAGLLYLDLWPITHPMMIVFDAEMIKQFTQTDSQPKWLNGDHKNFEPFTALQDLVTLDGQDWKMARSMFNPGFSAANLYSMVPMLLEEVLEFRERLQKLAATGEVVKFEYYTLGLTIDMIGRVVLGTRFHYQRQETRLMKTLLKQMSLLYFNLRPLVQLDPTRLIRHWIYNRQIHAELAPLIKNAAQKFDRVEGSKTVITQAVSVYLDRNPQPLRAGSVVSPEFVDAIVNHIKMFLFAGHDTTSSALSYVFYLLSIHPEEAAKVRAEHDRVFGPDPKTTADRILSDPMALNRLPYTSAVVKETLRLFPPVGGGTREARPGFMLVNPKTGKQYPTGGFMMFSSVSTVARDPEYWPEADRFLPERWLITDESDPYHPIKGTWRPFEMAPRNCIGQELANLELRLALVLTVREFDIQDMYETDGPTVFGVKGYQVDTETNVTAHVKGGLPCKILARC